jgi:hypothetical protein
MMSSIFHYSDAAGLSGILSSELLFASDYRFLNDTSEVGIIRDLVLPVFETEIAEITPKLVANKLLKGFYEFHGISGHRAQAEGFFNTLLRLVNETTPLFRGSDDIVQFSRRGLREDETIWRTDLPGAREHW